MFAAAPSVTLPAAPELNPGATSDTETVTAFELLIGSRLKLSVLAADIPVDGLVARIPTKCVGGKLLLSYTEPGAKLKSLKAGETYPVTGASLEDFKPSGSCAQIPSSFAAPGGAPSH